MTDPGRSVAAFHSPLWIARSTAATSLRRTSAAFGSLMNGNAFVVGAGASSGALCRAWFTSEIGFRPPQRFNG